VIRVPGLVGSRFTGYSIADNRTAGDRRVGTRLLAQIVAELNLDVDFDLSALGFDDKELTEILDWNIEDDSAKEDGRSPLPRDTRLPNRAILRAR